MHSDNDMIARANALYIFSNWAFERSRDHATGCYNSGNNFTAAACDSYILQRPMSTVNTSDICPFLEGCITPAITISSGIIDSKDYVGMNAPLDNRIQYEKKLSCAVLEADKYATDFPSPGPTKIFPWDPDNIADANYKVYNFGEQKIFQIKRNFTLAEGSFRQGPREHIQQSMSRSVLTDLIA